MRQVLTAVAGSLIMASAAWPALAQTPSDDAHVTEIDEVVILARRSGAPMWTVRRGESTLILVGAISGVPRDVEWRPDSLQQAAGQADLVLTPQEGRVSISDILRVIWRARTIGILPQGRTTADYLEPEWQARLETLMAEERGDSWRRQSLLFLGMDLMREKAGFREGRQGEDAADVTRRAARRARVEVRPVGSVRGAEIVDSLIEAPQDIHVPCVEAGIAAAEAGPNAARERAENWSRLRVPEVVASPIDQALGRCWPWADPELAPLLHQQWTDAIASAMAEPRITLAVAPVRLLGESGGVLDRLEAEGFDIEGPVWREDQR